MTDPLPPEDLPPLLFNQRLLQWLSDDARRAALYAHLQQQQRVLSFQSTAAPEPTAGTAPRLAQNVVLLTERAHVLQALGDARHFSNAPYRALGSGSFMLGLDGMAHAEQLGFARRALRHVGSTEVHTLAALAWRSASVLALQTRRFDAALLAEQVGLRFVALLFGFPLSLHPVLEVAMQQGYRQLVYQIIGRHFTVDPGVEAGAKLAGARLLVPTVELLAQYATGELPHELARDLEELRQVPGLAQFTPVCQRLAQDPGDHSLAELAVVVLGLVAGTIGNLQASVAIALDALVHGPQPAAADRPAGGLDLPLHALAQLAREATPNSGARVQLQQRVLQALALNPPAAFLPRQVVAEVALCINGREVVRLQPGTQVLLAIGAATRQPPGPTTGRADPLVFGGGTHAADGQPLAQPALHACVGEFIALPLTIETVRQVLMLPGLTAALDPATGAPLRLQKTWGFRCDTLPLEYARQNVVLQQPLSVVMNVRQPVAENAAKLRKIIAAGAPRIQLRLEQSHQVHFAWFLLLNQDRQLALLTSFDGDFDTYLEHFAQRVGPLFDKLFECLDDPPPLPVADFPQEFVAKVRRYNATPVGPYFYSAYPQATVADVQRALPAKPA